MNYSKEMNHNKIKKTPVQIFEFFLINSKYLESHETKEDPSIYIY